MYCSQCQHENREEAKFCEACGSKLELSCPACGKQVRPGAAFCDNCGTPLKPQSKIIRSSSHKVKKSTARPDARRQMRGARRGTGERRQLTVMFCDLVDSTALAEKLDPEEWQAVVQEYHRICGEVIRRFDGHIAQPLGDGLLVYFGYPAAHEDDAQRAARGGLEIIAAIGGQGTGNGGQGGQPPLRVRIGIHTGLVVVGEVGAVSKREQLALGSTPNIAARLQGLAQPNTVVVSATTHKLIAGLLDCQELGFHTLKGISAPMQVYRVVGEGEGRSRIDV